MRIDQTPDEKAGWDSGLRHKDVPTERIKGRSPGGHSIEWWHARMAGDEARKALEKAAGITVAEMRERGPYLYGTGGYFYGDSGDAA